MWLEDSDQGELTASVYDGSRNDCEAGCIAEGVRGSEEKWRISFIFRLIESSVGNDQGNVVGKASVIEGSRSRDGHILGIHCVCD